MESFLSNRTGHYRAEKKKWYLVFIVKKPLFDDSITGCRYAGANGSAVITI